jgi:putative GTP pyrophosphokinase
MRGNDFYTIPKEELKERYHEAGPVFTEALNSVKIRIRAAAAGKDLSVTVRDRVKSFTSWHAKLLRSSKAGEKKSAAITDILGIRIICPFLEEIELVANMLQELFEIKEHEVKGANYPYQHFGYESVHFLIVLPEEALPEISTANDFLDPRVCEIQVRTILQDAWAEVEHELVYKSDFSPLDQPLKRKLAALNANLTLSDIMFQEIRDYQRELHAALRQRRKDFYDCISLKPEGNMKAVTLPAAKIQAGNFLRETVDALLLRGLLAHNQNRYDEAIEIYSNILLREISNDIRAIILVHRGMAYFSSDLNDEALKDFNKAIELNPGKTKARYYRAIHSRVNEDFANAFEDIEECLKSDPYNLEYLTARAETLAAAGDLQSAGTECRSILQTAPDFKPALRLLKNLEQMDR